MKYLLIAVGGASGALARYILGGIINNKLGPGFPYGTLVINISGSFILGLFMTLGTERFLISPNWRLLIAIGFLGAYTTFSTFSYETMTLLADGSIMRAGLNVVASVFIGLLACWVGILIGRMI